LANVITISGTTFSNLGLTAGSSYSWSVTGSSVTDTVTFNIGSVTPVPEASGSVAGLGLAMAGLYQLRRRKMANAVES
jgi:MYXO-CTERM domain-containing protein